MRGFAASRRVLAALGLAATAAGPTGITSCSECAGTPSCIGEPTASVTGQLIVHKSGARIAGAKIEWVRRIGVPLDSDTLRTETDAEGFFTLRSGSVYEGRVGGDLTVTPPPPYAPFTLLDVVLVANVKRGDGGYIGRYTVDPFIILIGEVHDANTGELVTEATIFARRVSGGRLGQDTITMRTDSGARFGWVDPQILVAETIVMEFEVRIPNDARVFVSRHELPMLRRDGDVRFISLAIPR
jgi:hypothetical protein